jgi:hypothetical protein
MEQAATQDGPSTQIKFVSKRFGNVFFHASADGKVGFSDATPYTHPAHPKPKNAETWMEESDWVAAREWMLGMRRAAKRDAPEPVIQAPIVPFDDPPWWMRLLSRGKIGGTVRKMYTRPFE